MKQATHYVYDVATIYHSKIIESIHHELSIEPASK